MASRFPSIVQVRLRDPSSLLSGGARVTPWDARLAVSGEGDRTKQFQPYLGSVTLTVARLERAPRALAK